MRLLLCGIVTASLGTAVYTQSRGPSSAVLYEGARLVVGDGSVPIEGGAFLVQDG